MGADGRRTRAGSTVPLEASALLERMADQLERVAGGDGRVLAFASQARSLANPTDISVDRDARDDSTAGSNLSKLERSLLDAHELAKSDDPLDRELAEKAERTFGAEHLARNSPGYKIWEEAAKAAGRI